MSVGRGDPPISSTSACSVIQRTRASNGGSTPSSQPMGRAHAAAYSSCMQKAGCVTNRLERIKKEAKSIFYTLVWGK